jgi:hypothetical protein
VLLVIRYWPIAALALLCAVPWVTVRLARHAPLRRTAVEALFAGYLGALFYVVFLLPVPAESGVAGSVWASVNLIPMRTVVGIIRTLMQRAHHDRASARPMRQALESVLVERA